MVAVSELEELFGRLWTQCQECQGSLHLDVLCTRFVPFPYSLSEKSLVATVRAPHFDYLIS